MSSRDEHDVQPALQLVATCALGLEELLAEELRALGVADPVTRKGAVGFRGTWIDVLRANWRLRTANRVLVALDSWPAVEDAALAAGAQRLVVSESKSWAGLDSRALFRPDRTLALRSTSSASEIRDTRWVTQKVKDGIVDGQREAYGRRSSIDRRDPDLPLRVWLHRDRATLLLDTSGEPLDRRGYRVQTTVAPVRENIAAACVLASRWDGRGAIVDPMCGSGTLLAEAASFALGWAPGRLRRRWAFERLPNFDPAALRRVQAENLPHPGQDTTLFGVDASAEAVEAARQNLSKADLLERASLAVGDAYGYSPPEPPGLVLVNPPHGERLEDDPAQWRRLGDLFKQRYRGWRAVVLAGGKDRGKHVGLKPSLRLPVKNGPLDARILVFDLY